MDIDFLSGILKELVLKNNRVSLPGLGSFIAEMAPSVFSDRAMVIHPPFRRILFRPSEIWNDGLLEEAYAQKKGISPENAAEEISAFVKELRGVLNSDKSYRIPEFGTMRATEQNDYFFVADKKLFNYLETFGLEPVNIKLLPKIGEVEPLTGKPEQTLPVVTAPVSEQADKPNQKPTPEPEPVPEPIPEPIPEPEHVPEPISEPISEPIPEPEPVPEHIPEPTPEPEPVTEPAPEPVPEPAPEPISLLDTVPVAPAKGGGFVRKVVITLSVIFILILIVVLLFVFKDQLRPFWEWILYTKEERELLDMFRN